MTDRVYIYIMYVCKVVVAGYYYSGYWLSSAPPSCNTFYTCAVYMIVYEILTYGKFSREIIGERSEPPLSVELSEFSLYLYIYIYIN